MKIAIFTDVFLPYISGVTISANNLAVELEKTGVDVEIFTPAHSKETKAPKLTGKNIKINYFPSVKTFIYPDMRVSLPISIKYLNKFRKANFDLIHFMTPSAMGQAAIYFSRIFKLPLVQTFHTFIADKFYLKCSRLDKIPKAEFLAWKFANYFINQCDVVTTPSEYARQEIIKHGAKVFTTAISNGIDVRGYSSVKKPILDVKKKYPFFDENTFIHFGRISVEKSIPILIQGFAKAISKEPKLKLVIIGDGPDLLDLQNYVKQLKLEKNIFLTGRINNKELMKSGLIQNSIAFITASKTENQPMTIIESISSGIPIIGADAAGNPELVKNNGLTFKSDNTSDLARKILRLYGDSSLQEKLRKNCQVNRYMYDNKTVVKQWILLYEMIINMHKQKRSKHDIIFKKLDKKLLKEEYAKLIKIPLN